MYAVVTHYIKDRDHYGLFAYLPSNLASSIESSKTAPKSTCDERNAIHLKSGVFIANSQQSILFHDLCMCRDVPAEEIHVLKKFSAAYWFSLEEFVDM